MTSNLSPDDDIPSFEELTSKIERTDIPARIHASAAPLRRPPGPIKISGANPAYRWFGDLPRTNPVLSKQLGEQVENLPGDVFRQAVWQAYTEHFYAVDRS